MPEPPEGKTPRLLVSYGGSLLWSLRLDECQTWFVSISSPMHAYAQCDDHEKKFISTFWEFWPRRFRIMYNGKALEADLWPRILNLAKHSSTNLRLSFHLGYV